jgi:LuxR family maltose regulon positive regulatory protein
LQLLLGTIEDDNMTHGHIALSRIRQAQGDAARALASIQRAEAWLEEMEISQPTTSALLAAHRARLWLRQGNLEAAKRWAAVSGLRTKDKRREARESEYLTLVRVLTVLGRRDREKQYLTEAQQLLDHLLSAAESHGRVGSMIEILGLYALVCQAQDNLSGAQATLERALMLAEPEGYVRIFVDEDEPMRLLLRDYQAFFKKKMSDGVDSNSLRLLTYTDKLLAAFSQPPPEVIKEQDTLPEPLSERELDILRLIATGRTNQEIAEILVIAVSTVKSHINNLYGKLGTNRRTQAIAIARELGLISE